MVDVGVGVEDVGDLFEIEADLGQRVGELIDGVREARVDEGNGGAGPDEKGVDDQPTLGIQSDPRDAVAHVLDPVQHIAPVARSTERRNFNPPTRR